MGQRAACRQILDEASRSRAQSMPSCCRSLLRWKKQARPREASAALQQLGCDVPQLQQRLRDKMSITMRDASPLLAPSSSLATAARTRENARRLYGLFATADLRLDQLLKGASRRGRGRRLPLQPSRREVLERRPQDRRWRRRTSLREKGQRRWTVFFSAKAARTQCAPRKASDFAPKGRRDVATGEAQPASSRAARNPWNTVRSFDSAPAGQRTLPGTWPISQTRTSRRTPPRERGVSARVPT